MYKYKAQAIQRELKYSTGKEVPTASEQALFSLLKDFRSEFTKAILGSTYSTSIKYMNKVEV